MKLLITGANGFIGSNLKNFLEKKFGNKKLTIITKNKNIITKKYWKDIPKVDLVIHLASKSNVRDSWFSQAEYVNKNILGTIRVLDFCKKYKIKLIFFSSYLYHGLSQIKSKETDKLKYNNPYALTKKNSEEWCNFYAKNFNMDICILRLFNVYGKFQKNKFYISSISDKLKKNNVIFINKKIYRDYLHIDDLNVLILKIIKNNKKIKGCETYNVGYGEAFNLFEIANILKKFLNSSSKISDFNKVDKNQIMYTRANISKISKTFNWFPKVSIYNGLKKIIK
jgi:nucleoside-diphosphate-sugar epimerase